jgi:hypothetical protein
MLLPSRFSKIHGKNKNDGTMTTTDSVSVLTGKHCPVRARV